MAKKEAISVRVSEEIKAKFIAICEKEHRTQPEQIAYWVENYKRDNEKKRVDD